MFKKILLPLDGSEVAEWALGPALKVAEATGGEVLLLQSMTPVYTMMPIAAGEYEWVWPEYAREDSRRAVREYLEAVQRAHQQPTFTLRTLVEEGDAASVIVDTAHDEDVDLIVMSTHGWTGLIRGVLGSVTERVLHSAPCPVLVTRSGEPISRILITLDGSQLAERALRPGLELATTLGAKVTLLRINEPVVTAARETTHLTWRDIDVGEQLPMYLRQNCESYLDQVLLRFDLNGPEVQTAVVDGPAVERILEFARLHGIHLIAMSTHGRTGLRRWLYGSVTAKVMRRSDCSMLIIRPSAHELNDG
jgi:nucleotide-binding universal stress UspA family protein